MSVVGPILSSLSKMLLEVSMQRASESVGRNQILGPLIHQFELHSTTLSSDLDRLIEELTPEEYDRAFDTIALYRCRSRFAEGKHLEAYNSLQDGLKKDPFNISLQGERVSFLSGAAEKLSELIKTDPQSPAIDRLYRILALEGAATVGHICGYINSLVLQKKWTEALVLVLPMLKLYPELLALQGIVQTLASVTAHPELVAHVRRPAEKHSSSWRKITISAATANQVSTLSRLLDWKQNVNTLDASDLKEIDRVLSEHSADSTYVVNFKDLYYFKGVILKQLGQFMESLFLLDALVSIDPCRIEFRKARDQSVHAFCTLAIELAEKNKNAFFIAQFYPLLRDMGFVSYVFLKAVCLEEIGHGKREEAKAKMVSLVELNPLDFDYVKAAGEVAVALGDEAWKAELDELKIKMLKVRPWDLDLRQSLEEENHEAK